MTKEKLLGVEWIFAVDMVFFLDAAGRMTGRGAAR